MKIEQPIPFVKMHGSGNDFVVIRRQDLSIPESDLPEFTRRVCRKGTGVAADGVILISPSSTADFHWHYINADGTDGDMCGNGAMVGARFAVEHEIASSSHTFDTAAGTVRAEVNGSAVTLDFVDATFLNDGLVFDSLPDVEFDHFKIGVPHVVGFVDDADDFADLDAIGRAIRIDSQLHPHGANVNIVNVIDNHSIRMRTYERGVEAETLACGTGAVCSAISASRRGLVQQPVSVRVSSGMDLQVSWVESGNHYSEITLSGTARVVARGELTPEILM